MEEWRERRGRGGGGEEEGKEEGEGRGGLWEEKRNCVFFFLFFLFLSFLPLFFLIFPFLSLLFLVLKEIYRLKSHKHRGIERHRGGTKKI